MLSTRIRVRMPVQLQEEFAAAVTPLRFKLAE
jgi:hypothetical protein